MYALAPVQIGIPKRIIYIKNSSQDMNKNTIEGYDEGIIYINPKIISEKGLTKFLEGCQSCSYEKNGVSIYYTGVIDRPYCVDIEYYDMDGHSHTKTLKDFEARVFCHEYDHLNGILHMDKIDTVFEMTLEEMKKFREKNPQEIISKI